MPPGPVAEVATPESLVVGCMTVRFFRREEDGPVACIPSGLFWNSTPFCAATD